MGSNFDTRPWASRSETRFSTPRSESIRSSRSHSKEPEEFSFRSRDATQGSEHGSRNSRLGSRLGSLRSGGFRTASSSGRPRTSSRHVSFNAQPNYPETLRPQDSASNSRIGLQSEHPQSLSGSQRTIRQGPQRAYSQLRDPSVMAPVFEDMPMTLCSKPNGSSRGFFTEFEPFEGSVVTRHGGNNLVRGCGRGKTTTFTVTFEHSETVGGECGMRSYHDHDCPFHDHFV
ncbi:hypothetical protein GLAREA_00976 [Glarea lozoyensis ATCC 20868]|uniref:Uncharacterized protein n=1 Tax=Glarea lozoyensis (strain ATCC 20868 / MF5171) TaxID=1116229 RepID=S3DCW7_GLAL2|nr:uncharacterized protein GLAREA_00976 [Glarea lozoyensis ATCC 20868]EPE29816.1 hypothetical protein GLAREA_00976 [Glarea lozoyensis ATCC 20868]